MPRRFALTLAIASAAHAAPVKILTIGDSLTDEYSEIADLANIITIDVVYPEPDPPNPDNNPTALNWAEILRGHRPAHADFGPFAQWGGLDFIFFIIPDPYGDLRYKGNEYNFAVASTTSTNWIEILTTDGTTSDFPFAGFFFPNTKNALFATLPSVDVAVIFLGGNDLKNDYFAIFNDGPPEPLFTEIHDRIETIHTILRTEAPSLPIIVATVPDVGATPNIFDVYNTPAIQVATRAKIAGMNQDIVDTFSAKPNTVVARVDNLTSDILDIVLGLVPGPYDLNGTEFIIDGEPFNSAPYLFCKDDFHPNTVGQVLIANEIIAAVNELFPDAITPFSNREILDVVLALDPDQPYLDWIAPYGLIDDGPDDDPDRDGLANLIEMILGTPPNAFSTPFSGAWPGGVSWTPADDRYAALTPEESPDLSGWTPVPAERLATDGSQVTATPPAGASSHYLRFRATPKP